jgi:hypothetical protein
MLCVFICSPYRGDIEANTKFAQEAMLDSFGRGEAPFTPHLLYPQVMDDGDEVDRNVATRAARAWLEMSDTLAVYTDLGISAGMQDEIAFAEENEIEIEYRELEGEEDAA